MSRYVPTERQRSQIDALRLAGYAVVRQATYDGLRKRVDDAEWRTQWEQRDADSARAWARDCCAEERRVRDRLMAVVAAAASLGVTIDAINAALAQPDTERGGQAVARGHRRQPVCVALAHALAHIAAYVRDAVAAGKAEAWGFEKCDVCDNPGLPGLDDTNRCSFHRISHIYGDDEAPR